MAKTVLVVGASRGLGFALASEYLARGWQVIGTVRGDGETPLRQLAETVHGRLEIEELDIKSEESIRALRQRLDGRCIDLIFSNAAVAGGAGERIASASVAYFTNLMVTNVWGNMRVIEAFETLVPPTGTIVAMSSILGSVASNSTGEWEVYRGSKAALNTMMRSFAAARPHDPRALILMVPGWVRTDMGGPDADLGIEESIPRVVDVVSAHEGRAGLVYVDYRGETIPW